MGDVVGAIVGLAVVGYSEGLAVVGNSKGLAVVGNSKGLAVVGYSEVLAVGVLVGLAVGVLVGMAVGDAEELAFVGDDMSELIGAAEGGSGLSTPIAITAAIIATAANNPNETSPSLYSRILCS
jgi:hypothetical protein